MGKSAKYHPCLCKILLVSLVRYEVSHGQEQYTIAAKLVVEILEQLCFEQKLLYEINCAHFMEVFRPN